MVPSSRSAVVDDLALAPSGRGSRIGEWIVERAFEQDADQRLCSWQLSTKRAT